MDVDLLYLGQEYRCSAAVRLTELAMERPGESELVLGSVALLVAVEHCEQLAAEPSVVELAERIEKRSSEHHRATLVVLVRLAVVAVA